MLRMCQFFGHLTIICKKYSGVYCCTSDVQGVFKYSIEVSELRPQIPEIDRQEISEFLFSLSNFLNSVLANPAGPMVFNIQGCIKEFAKAYPSLNPENMLNMDVTPEQVANALINQQQGQEGSQDAPV